MASVEELHSVATATTAIAGTTDSRVDGTNPTVVAIENSSPEVIHVVNVSSATALTPGIAAPHVVTLAGLPGNANPHGIQTLTIAAANQLGFPVTLSGTPLVSTLLSQPLNTMYSSAYHTK